MATKRELERRADRLGAGPTASVAQLLSADSVDVVDAEERVVRIDGRRYSVDRDVWEVVFNALEA